MNVVADVSTLRLAPFVTVGRTAEQDAADEHRCPGCDGKGVVDVPETLYRSERTETCRECDGWGRVDWADQERRAPRRAS